MRRFGVCALGFGLVTLAACGSDDPPGDGSPSAGKGGTTGTGGSSGSAGTGAAGTGAAGGTDGAGGVSGSGGAGSGGGGMGGQSGSAGSGGGSAGTAGSGSLPEGNNGIARGYPNDTGIGTDEEVIFADDFESYTQVSQIGQRWDNTFQNNQIRITTDARNLFVPLARTPGVAWFPLK